MMLILTHLVYHAGRGWKIWKYVIRTDLRSPIIHDGFRKWWKYATSCSLTRVHLLYLTLLKLHPLLSVRQACGWMAIWLGRAVQSSSTATSTRSVPQNYSSVSSWVLIIRRVINLQYYNVHVYRSSAKFVCTLFLRFFFASRLVVAKTRSQLVVARPLCTKQVRARSQN